MPIGVLKQVIVYFLFSVFCPRVEVEVNGQPEHLEGNNVPLCVIHHHDIYLHASGCMTHLVKMTFMSGDFMTHYALRWLALNLFLSRTCVHNIRMHSL